MDTLETIIIDAVGPMTVVRPSSAAEVGEIVRRAATDGTAIYPVGGGTMLDYGMPPARPGIAVELRALDKVIDFPARDMTITVEAGITIAKLNEITRAEGLHLPIDVPDPERATLGGAIACNVSGPRRYGYGTFRDYILGITTVNDRGELASAGGRVVKNVAGYDLMKLHTGALGTLGIITQVTLKLKPIPECHAVVAYGCGRGSYDDGPLGMLLDLLHHSQTRPTCIEVLNQAAAQALQLPIRMHWQIVVGFEGNRAAVGWQIGQLRRELEGTTAADVIVFDLHRSEGLLSALVNGRRLPNDKVAVRAIMPRSFVAYYCEACTAAIADIVHAHAGSGVVLSQHANRREDDLKRLGLLADDTRETESNKMQNANEIIVRCPSDWKSSMSVWGRPPADIALQKAVKRALDPKNVFNPGRFVTDAF